MRERLKPDLAFRLGAAQTRSGAGHRHPEAAAMTVNREPQEKSALEAFISKMTSSRSSLFSPRLGASLNGCLPPSDPWMKRASEAYCSCS